jgi:hypothetical protein
MPAADTGLGEPKPAVQAGQLLGAHQLARPSTCVNAGTRIIRTRVASTRIARVSPTPNIRMNDTCAAISAATLRLQPVVRRDDQIVELRRSDCVTSAD